MVSTVQLGRKLLVIFGGNFYFVAYDCKITVKDNAFFRDTMRMASCSIEKLSTGVIRSYEHVFIQPRVYGFNFIFKDEFDNLENWYVPYTDCERV